MNFWKKIFSTTTNASREGDKENNPSPDFKKWVGQAIGLIGTMGGNMENDEVVDLLIDSGIEEKEAVEIFIFLPMAFCRKLLPELAWPTDYFDYYSPQKKVRKSYSTNERYQIILAVTNQYWNDNPDNQTVLSIAGRSSEFQAINKLLHDGGKLEDVRLTESYIMR